ncbi:odorant receptor 45b-like [Vespula maculifrons]|uniref:Odorant receptor 45b-like n=1 Tax=Vespula maculifrons TaxID=7453 RepID=A0ABD2BPH6_VESMC
MGRDSIEEMQNSVTLYFQYNNDCIYKTELGIANVRRSFNWSSRLLKCMGIWPLKNYDPIFFFFFTYLFLHCSLAYAQMFLSPKTMDDVLSYVAENIPLTMTLMKIIIIRVNREALSKLFTEIKEYSLTEKYETKEEKMTFLNYTKLPPRFIVVTVCSMTLSDILYYTNGLSFGIQIVWKVYKFQDRFRKFELESFSLHKKIIKMELSVEFDNNVLK